jgi:hypothetical protein
VYVTLFQWFLIIVENLQHFLHTLGQKTTALATNLHFVAAASVSTFAAKNQASTYVSNRENILERWFVEFERSFEAYMHKPSCMHIAHAYITKVINDYTVTTTKQTGADGYIRRTTRLIVALASRDKCIGETADPTLFLLWRIVMHQAHYSAAGTGNSSIH